MLSTTAPVGYEKLKRALRDSEEKFRLWARKKKQKKNNKNKLSRRRGPSMPLHYVPDVRQSMSNSRAAFLFCLLFLISFKKYTRPSIKINK